MSDGSDQKVYWLCGLGHHYQSTIANRKAGNGCSVCGSRTVLPGFNDLATTNPALAAEWDYERNAPLTPQEVTEGSNQKAHWICPLGHNYVTTVANRSSGTGCTICAGKRILPGFNDLATRNPALAAEWDYERNAPLTPRDVATSANKKAFWLCSEGHSYQASINSRNRGTACASCADSGYDPNQEGLFYFISNSELQARKIGITNPGRKTDRLAGYGPGWTINATYRHRDGFIIRQVETNLLRWLRKDLGLPAFLGKEEMPKTGGYSETFSSEGPSDLEVVAKIEQALLFLDPEWKR